MAYFNPYYFPDRGKPLWKNLGRWTSASLKLATTVCSAAATPFLFTSTEEVGDFPVALTTSRYRSSSEDLVPYGVGDLMEPIICILNTLNEAQLALDYFLKLKVAYKFSLSMKICYYIVFVC